MLLSLQPSTENQHPLAAWLVKGDDPMLWLRALDELSLSITDVKIYALPGAVPNSVWGCLLVPDQFNDNHEARYESCRLMFDQLFVPSDADVTPPIDREDMKTLFRSALHLMHPEIGLVELEAPLDLKSLLVLPQASNLDFHVPKDGVVIHDRVERFHVLELPEEESLDGLTKQIQTDKKQFDNKPLSQWEKMKLKLYQRLFFQSKEKNDERSESEAAQPTKLMQWLASTFPEWGKKKMSQMQEDYETLRERNQKELDKLMKLMKDDPDEALKYAIPLDTSGGFRGNQKVGGFQMNKRWDNISIWGARNGASRGGGAGVDVGDRYAELRTRYNQMAKDFEERGDYQRAAFVYLNLLQNAHQAASVLERGKLYLDAAKVFLEKCKSKTDAARCFELGKNYEQAAWLYVDQDRHEKAGDMYVRLGKTDAAHRQYEKVVAKHLKNSDHVKAADVYKQKMNEQAKGQAVLLAGWRARADAYHCLHHYFEDLRTEEELWQEMQQLRQEVTDANCLAFLLAAKAQHQLERPIQSKIKQMAYELVVAHGKKNRKVISMLTDFNANDPELRKDISRYRA